MKQLQVTLRFFMDVDEGLTNDVREVVEGLIKGEVQWPHLLYAETEVIDVMELNRKPKPHVPPVDRDARREAVPRVSMDPPANFVHPTVWNAIYTGPLTSRKIQKYFNEGYFAERAIIDRRLMREKKAAKSQPKVNVLKELLDNYNF